MMGLDGSYCTCISRTLWRPRVPFLQSPPQTSPASESGRMRHVYYDENNHSNRGLMFHPSIWHEARSAIRPTYRFGGPMLCPSSLGIASIHACNMPCNTIYQYTRCVDRRGRIQRSWTPVFLHQLASPRACICSNLVLDVCNQIRCRLVFQYTARRQTFPPR